MSPPSSEIAQRLVDRIRGYQSAAVTFSGGVDSAVVAKAAVLALRDKAIAVTAVSPSLSAAELQQAVEVASEIGIRHLQISTQEFERPEYRANAGDRCYFCKDTLYSLTSAQLAALDVACILNGANTDDLGDHRPGMQAALKHQVLSPLIDERIDKANVRELARFWNLSVAEKPAAPCLASRIAYGVEVTEERVSRVEQAEAYLKQITGIQQLRVRCEANELARIEVPLNYLSLLADATVRSAVTNRLKSIGFRCVTLDLEGFRSGSLNDALPVLQLRLPDQGS